MDTRGGQSRILNEPAVGLSSNGSGSGLVGGGQPRVMSTGPAAGSSVHGGGSLLLGGATTNCSLTGDPARRPADMDHVPVRLGTVGGVVDGGRRNSDGDCWNPRASMAFDSAKGLLNPVGENNCFLNSAVQVCQWSSCLFRSYHTAVSISARISSLSVENYLICVAEGSCRPMS